MQKILICFCVVKLAVYVAYFYKLYTPVKDEWKERKEKVYCYNIKIYTKPTKTELPTSLEIKYQKRFASQLIYFVIW